MAATRVGLTAQGGTAAFSVAAHLAAFDDARLGRLLAARPDLGERLPTTFAGLADRVTALAGAQAAYRRLDRGAQQVVEALCLLPRVVPAARLADLLGPGAGPAELAEPLGRLEEAALVFRSGDELRLNPGLSSLRHPAGLGPPASVSLSRPSVAQLGVICRRLGVPAGATKAATLGAIAAALADAARLLDVIGRGPEGTADLAERVAVAGPEVTVPYGASSLDDRTPVGWLAAHGLLVVVGWDRLVMPGEAGLALRGGRPFPGFSPSPPALVTTAVDPARVDAGGTEQGLRLVADVAAVLDAWSANPPKLLKDGGIGVREVRRAAQLVGRDERDAARLADLAAAAAGLAAADLRSGTALPLVAYDDWLALDLPGRWAWLVEGWLGAELHPSVAGALDTKEKRIPPLLTRAPERGATSRRRMVLEALAGVVEGSAAEPASVLARVGWTDPEAWSGGPASLPTLVRWVPEEAELLGLLAMGSLTGPGRLAVAGRMEEAVAAFTAHAPVAVTEFVLQGDLTAVAAGALAPAVAAEMELLADVESRGAATVYRFTDASLGRAFDAGRSAADIAAFLRRHAAGGVPQALGYLVTDLGRRHGRVRVAAAGCYVRSDDPSLLRELLHTRVAARLRLRPLAPTVLASGADAEVVLATLRTAGYLPAAEDEAGALVLARPAAPRATLARPVRRVAPGGPAAARPPAVAAAVAALRRSASPPSPPAAPPRPKVASPPDHRTMPMWEPDDERPTAIAKGRFAVLALLEEAYDQDWMVRLSYVDAKGREDQLNVSVVEIDGAHMVVDCHPRWDTKQLNVDRARWARVLTEAEEVQLL